MPSVRLVAPLLALAVVGCFTDNPPAAPVPDTGDSTTAAAISSTGAALSTGAIASTGEATTAESCPEGMTEKPWYKDKDEDGWGAGEPVVACTPPDGSVDRAGDCDDEVPARNPDATEVCDGRDDDCDGLRDEYSAKNTGCDGCVLAELAGAPFWFCQAPDDTVLWTKGRELCTAYGAGVDLASIHSADENTFVANNLKLLGIPIEFETTFWLGLRRPDADLATCADTQVWIWSDGSAFDYSSWGPDQPDNNPTLEGCDPACTFDGIDDADCPRENCVDWAGIGGWNDVSCHLPGTGFICRGPAPGDMS